MAVKTVRDVLVAAGAVTTLVPASRITPLVRPQAISVPAITLQRISLTPNNHLRGDAGLDANRVQLDAYAETYAAARAVADACRAALVAAGHLLQTEFDSHEPETDPDLYRVTQEYNVWT